MQKLNTAFISVGSNIEREKNIIGAVALLKNKFPKIKVSPIYNTPFFGKGHQPDYLNFCAKITTTKTAPQLKKLFRTIEAFFGRQRSGRKDSQRTLDIDLLLFNDLVDKNLNLPYKDFEKKAYVLVPLASIAPRLFIKPLGKSLTSLLGKLSFSQKNSITKVLLQRKNNYIAMKPHYFAVVATTIDGFIARNRSHRSTWTSKEDKKHLFAMIDLADAIILTRSGYSHADRSRKKHCIVITRSVKSIKEKNPKLTFLNVKNSSIDRYVRSRGFREVCILGGTFVYGHMLQKGLIDDLYLTIEPLAFGSGLSIFGKSVPTKNFKLIQAKKLNKQSILLHYKYLRKRVAK